MLNNKKELTMDTLRIKGNWNQIKNKIKQKFPDLTDDDLTFVEGRENELLGKIQRRTGRSRDEVVNYINSINK
jgi:uncharacterized protein YjbJ (UPF0337 family)